ncbi:COG3650 family protein [Rubellimicrobium arenae]|uniref:COG3650 family protein n=1 Tax=Rubellimicrobium arenae TaxID=2817372 RepID=UPI001B311B60|nr:SH3 domain-containing protein [Rubellimicrobium arenae]
MPASMIARPTPFRLLARILPTVALLLAAGTGHAQILPARYAVAGVAANDVLNVRAEPQASAPVLATLAPGARGVEVLAISEDGRWARVSLPEGAGWAALRFLSAEAAAPGPVPRPLRCLGTEPFWSIRLSEDASVFDSPESGAVPLRPLGEAGGRVGAVAAFDAGGETLDLTLIRQECSDGMSDRPYGFAALAWNRGEVFLEGCCTVSSQ